MTAALVIAAALGSGNAPPIYAQSPAPRVQAAPVGAPAARPVTPVQMAQVQKAAPASSADKAAPKFEVASVRATISQADWAAQQRATGHQPFPAQGLHVSGLRVDTSGMTIMALIGEAYGTDLRLIVAPDWGNQGHARFAIRAIMPEGSTQEQVPGMLRALLEDRFHLVAHRTVSEQPGYALVTGKNGPKLKRAGDVDRSTCTEWAGDVTDPAGIDNQTCSKHPPIGESGVDVVMWTNGPYGPTTMTATGRGQSHDEYFSITMPKLARLLTNGLSGPAGLAGSLVPVVDRTGIEGAWHVELDSENADRFGAISASLEKQGLRLERITAPVEKLTIDSVDKVPTGN